MAVIVVMVVPMPVPVVMVVPMPVVVTMPVIVIVVVPVIVGLARGGADVALVVVIMPVVMVMPVIVVMVVIVTMGTAFDGEVQGVGGSVSPQRAAKPAEYAPASRCLVMHGLREGPSERGSVYSHT